jgi:hypothetical protein
MRHHRCFHGVILIDVWQSQHSLVNEFYARLCAFLTTSVSFQRIILPNYGYGQIDSRFRQLGRVSTIDCWSEFQNLGYDHGDWLLGGQSWRLCTHDRDLGLVPAFERGLESKLFSHPTMMLQTLDCPEVKVTDLDFDQDPQVTWQLEEDGYWLAKGLAGTKTT